MAGETPTSPGAGAATATIAHDFNNLLGIVIGNLDLLAERCASDAEATVLVQEALEAALRGTTLAQQLQETSRR